MVKQLISIILLFATAAAQAHAEFPAVTLQNPGFEEGEAGALPGWSSSAMQGNATQGHGGFRVAAEFENPAEGTRSLLLESVGEPEAGQFGVVMQAIEVQALRGRRVRLTAQVRTDVPDGTQVGLWLRVDREGGGRGFFDNMSDRPISARDWREFAIEGNVASDASKIVFGLLLAGRGRVWLDDVRIEDVGPADAASEQAVIGPPRDGPVPGDVAATPVDPRGLANLKAFARVYGLVRWFHPSDAAAAADWTDVALAGIPLAERARSPRELAEALRATFAPVAPTMRIAVGTQPPPRSSEEAGKRLRWRHKGMGEDQGNLYSSERETFDPQGNPPEHAESLPGGVAIRLPLTVAVADDGKTLPRASDRPLPTGKPAGWTAAGFDRTTRLAGTVIAWNLFKHFYPYWDQAGGDWNAALGPALEQAALAPDDRAFHQVLRRFTALPRDGHTWLWYISDYGASLPLAWEWVENELVVTAVGQGKAGIEPGAVVEAIDGRAVEELIAEEMAFIAGSPQWQRVRALERLRTQELEGTAVLTLREPGGGLSTVALPFERVPYRNGVKAERPEVVTEIAPKILYIDITRLDRARFEAEADRISAAEGLVFDLRGYPKGEFGYLAHMSDDTILSAKMDVPAYVAPDAAVDSWRSGGWEIEPKLPRYTDNVAFMTNGGAISFSESILGTVKANRLGTIVGEATAGANGNITSFVLPGGYTVTWTAMRVINRDGSPHHIVGVTPDLSVKRTIAGIRAGRDELLEAAVAEVRRQIEED